jgi:hypothetical protein
MNDLLDTVSNQNGRQVERAARKSDEPDHSRTASGIPGLKNKKLPNEPISAFRFPTANQSLMPISSPSDPKNEPILQTSFGLHHLALSCLDRLRRRPRGRRGRQETNGWQPGSNRDRAFSGLFGSTTTGGGVPTIKRRSQRPKIAVAITVFFDILLGLSGGAGEG